MGLMLAGVVVDWHAPVDHRLGPVVVQVVQVLMRLGITLLMLMVMVLVILVLELLGVAAWNECG